MLCCSLILFAILSSMFLTKGCVSALGVTTTVAGNADF